MRRASAASIRALSSAVGALLRRGSTAATLTGAGTGGGALTSWNSGEVRTRRGVSDWEAGAAAGPAGTGVGDAAGDVVTSRARPSRTTGSFGSSTSCFSYEPPAGTGDAAATISGAARTSAGFGSADFSVEAGALPASAAIIGFPGAESAPNDSARADVELFAAGSEGDARSKTTRVTGSPPPLNWETRTRLTAACRTSCDFFVVARRTPGRSTT